MTKQTPKPTTDKNPGRIRRAHVRARHHYYRVMPDKKHHRVLVWALFLSYSAVVAVQMLYPPDRALPLATVFGQNVAWQNDEELAKRLNDTGLGVEIRLQAGAKEVIRPIGALGAEPQTDGMIRQVTEYPFWQRFLPLSIFWQNARVDELDVSYSTRMLDEFSDAAAKQLNSKPVNARLSIKGGELLAIADTPGLVVGREALKKEIKSARLHPGTNSIMVPMAMEEAETTERDFTTVKSAAKAALGRQVEIIVEDESFTPERKTIASWLVISSKKGEPVLGFDAKQFGKYLDVIDKKIGSPAGVTHVTITDGRETKRTEGRVGRAIDRQPLTNEMKEWLLTGEATIPLMTQLHDVAPEIMYNNKYTTTEAGLQAYVKDISKQMDVHIAIRQIGGNGWRAEARAGDSIPSASTYKLYVAKWLFDQMDAGKTSWNSPMLGTTVSDCFDQMTIASTNACAQEWLRQVGRSNMNNYVWELGFSHGTTFTHPEATHSTARDLLEFMVKLNDESIVGGAHRDRLLHSLSVHPYRKGIPAGSDGKVYDKVGFLWDYVHDAAIVRHPRGTYVMVVMTKGQSYARIAEITRQVEHLMYP